MKTLIVFFAVLMLALGACEETVYKEIIKYVDRPALAPVIITVIDTVKITDTLEVQVIIREVDTVFQVVIKDSLIIKEVEKIVTILDTIIQNQIDTVFVTDTLTLTVYDRTISYIDTFYAVSYLRPVFSVPDDIIPHLEEFNALCQQYGKQATLGVIIVQYVDELPGENWSSNSFQVAENSQIVIQLDQRYPAALHRAGMLRELSRIGLNKKYTTIPDRIMNPTFSPEATITTNDLNQLFQ